MAQQSPQSQGGDNAFAPIWIVLGIFLAGYLIWKYFHRQIVSFVFSINLLQAKIINFFLHNATLSNDIYMMETLNPSTVTWDQLMIYTDSVGDFSKYVVGAALVIMAYYLYKSDVTLRYRKVHDMKSLRMQEQLNWPAIMPVVPKALEQDDISVGVWAWHYPLWSLHASITCLKKMMFY